MSQVVYKSTPMNETVALIKADNPWLTDAMVRVIADAYVDYGDQPTLLLNEVRNGAGRDEYDRLFPGNRREDGTFRLNENAYLSNKYQYENTLRLRGLNPSVFEAQFGMLIEGDVSPSEFESRVAAINENIVQRSEGFRRAFAEASGLDDFTDEGVLAVALDPSGVGRELLERRISLAQIRGSALDTPGITRSQQRAEQLFRRGVSAADVVAFDRSAATTLNRLDIVSRAYGTQRVGQRALEQAALEGDALAAQRVQRVLQREAAGFSSQTGIISRNQQGALTGLAPNRTR